jgi:hypothetical protein
VHGAGDTEHVDFAIQVEEGPDAAPVVMVEIKRVGVDLTKRHLKQASRYAIDAGCEWVLLTNGREWQFYHVEFGQPPITKLVEEWDLLHDAPEALTAKFQLVSYRNVKQGNLGKLWERTEALSPSRLLTAILSRDSLTTIRRALRRETGVRVRADQIVTALRKMLNEATAGMLEDIEVSLPSQEPKKRVTEGGERVTLKALVDAGLVPQNAELFVDYKGTKYTAVVQGDGSVLFEGKSYRSPSAAGGAVTEKHGIHAPNGWKFWSYTDAAGKVKELDEARQAFVTAGGDGDT